MYKSRIESYGEQADGDPDNVYLNLDIINNTTSDPVAAGQQDPQIRFNETRDAPIVKDASKYQFTIVRFSMNGANKDLPLFIPLVKTITPAVPVPGIKPENYTEYESAISYEQTWVTTNQPGGIRFTIAPPVRPVNYVTETQNPVVAPNPRNPTLGSGQDLTSRYYWVYTYQHWVDLVNATWALCQNDTFVAFQTAWAAAATGNVFPYANIAAWQAAVGPPPKLVYDETTGLFSIWGSALSFTNNSGIQVPAGTYPTPGPAPIQSAAPLCRLFFDTNMFGLFSNFSNTYWGAPTGNPFPAATVGPQTSIAAAAAGYVNEILFPNKQYQNLSELAAPVVAPDLGYYWVVTQDYESTSSLWSPIASIVFTSTLLPIRTEATGAPLALGSGNLGYSSASIQNAFAPIVTDIALDLANDGSDAYRKMIYYSPVAEYRMASLTPSRQTINSIDIQVFWKNRLDGNLYPVQMYNQSSVSIKCLFRRFYH
jgi:hypothetical protein